MDIKKTDQDEIRRRKIQEYIFDLEETLETAVEERTRELNKINSQLNQELLERRRMEEALRESEERYRTLLEASPDPIVVYDNVGNVLYFNQAFSDHFGWSLPERLGQKMDMFVPDEAWPETREMIDMVKAGKRFTENETRRRTKSGSIIDVSISGTVFHQKDGAIAGSIITLRDISQRKKFEYRLQQARNLEAIGTLAGGIAHDFNNLLMGFQGNISLMLLETPEGSDHHNKLEKMEEFIERGAALTKRLLGFARRGKYEVQPTDLNQFLETTAGTFAQTNKAIDFDLQTAPELATVEIDQGQMEEVLLNLFLNSWQAMPGHGTIYLATENVSVDAESAQREKIRPGDYVKISITDTGMGMDEETQQKIFDPFFTTKEIGIGTGLGLASVYGIIKNHGGSIHVYSEEGKGSTFTILLPVAAGHHNAAPAPNGLEIVPGSETILIVDDEEMILEVGQSILDTLGYSVLCAGDGKEALEILGDRRKSIDLVILDMIMPHMGGKEIFDKMKQIDPGVKVLLSSGYSINEQAREILEKGCDGFIQKPFNIKQLSTKIREIVGPAQVAET